jgi:hypothetical protein
MTHENPKTDAPSDPTALAARLASALVGVGPEADAWSIAKAILHADSDGVIDLIRAGVDRLRPHTLQRHGERLMLLGRALLDLGTLARDAKGTTRALDFAGYLLEDATTLADRVLPERETRDAGLAPEAPESQLQDHAFQDD